MSASTAPSCRSTISAACTSSKPLRRGGAFDRTDHRYRQLSNRVAGAQEIRKQRLHRDTTGRAQTLEFVEISTRAGVSAASPIPITLAFAAHSSSIRCSRVPNSSVIAFIGRAGSRVMVAMTSLTSVSTTSGDRPSRSGAVCGSVTSTALRRPRARLQSCSWPDRRCGTASVRMSSIPAWPSPRGPRPSARQPLVGRRRFRLQRKQIEFLRKDIPLRRLTNAEDIANSVVWISSDETDACGGCSSWPR